MGSPLLTCFSPCLLLCPSLPSSCLKAHAIRAAIEEEFNRTSTSNPRAIARASKSQFLWAVAVVQSRAFSLAPLADIPFGLDPEFLVDPFFSGSKIAAEVLKKGQWPAEGVPGQQAGRGAGPGAGQVEEEEEEEEMGGGRARLLSQSAGDATSDGDGDDDLLAGFGISQVAHRGRVSRFGEPLALLPLADLAEHAWNASMAVQVGWRRRRVAPSV